jgi:hypothetical protein
MRSWKLNKGGGLSMTSASSLRVSNHNNWPVIELFQCEKDLMARMAHKNIQQIFITTNFIPDDLDEAFNNTVGHILDCLDCLPRRPDLAFDCLYKAFDQALKKFSQPDTPRMLSVINTLFSSHYAEWQDIIQILTSNIPQQTADYAASRILKCYVDSTDLQEIQKRAGRSFGKQRYQEFRNKFLVQAPQNQNIFSLPHENERNAGRLMYKMLKVSSPLVTRSSHTASTYPELNLSDATKLLAPKEKLNVLMEICLATYRHERFHGEAFSPFRSSKARLKTYAHAYYMLFITYILILGMLQHEGKGGISIQNIVDITSQGMDRFASFFEEVLKE